MATSTGQQNKIHNIAAACLLAGLCLGCDEDVASSQRDISVVELGTTSDLGPPDVPATVDTLAKSDLASPALDMGNPSDGAPGGYRCPAPAAGAKELRVSAQATHTTIASALAVAQAGDTIVVDDGQYQESLEIKQGGSSNTKRLTLCAANHRKATITATGRVLTVEAPYVSVIGFVLDGKWGQDDIVGVTDAGDHLLLSRLEIKNGGADGIDIGGGSAGGCEGITIEDCTIHHLLKGSTTDQQDAHCIVATDFRDLTIRRTEAYYCSGDSLQVGTDRHPWDGLLVEQCRFWTGPLPAAAGLFAKGEVPGENAIDTKAKPHAPPWNGTFTIRDSVFFGFDPKSAYISNRAALNLKDEVTGLVERCTIYGNEVALRIRGGSGERGGVDGLVIKNTVLHDNQFHARLEDDAKNVSFLHNTFGRQIDANYTPQATAKVGQHYRGGGGGDEGPGWRSANNLFLSDKPALAGASDVAVSDSAATFVAMDNADYHLRGEQNASAGVGVTVDRDGKTRSSDAPDVGAYER